MNSYTTQCPHCQTTFRVTDEQLTAAAGKVRCGSCLHVFAAAEHGPDPRADVETTDNGGDDDFLIDDRADDTDDAAPPPETADELEFSDSFLSAGSDATAPGSDLFRELQEVADELDSDDEQWARELLADVETDTDRDHSPTEYTHADPGDAAADEPTFVERWLTGDDDSDDADHGALFDVGDGDDDGLEHLAGRREPLVDPTPARARHRALAAIESEPLILNGERAHRPWRRQALWGVGVVLMLAAATLQYGWYHRADLAREATWRPVYAFACRLAGCTLPARSDVSRIRGSNLIVRTDPEHPGALSLDAVITNTAPFGQPWPKLRVDFAKLDGSPAASRVFTPAEYLGGEAAGRRLMPSHQPVHIALELADPGLDAVNYQIALVAPARP